MHDETRRFRSGPGRPSPGWIVAFLAVSALVGLPVLAVAPPPGAPADAAPPTATAPPPVGDPPVWESWDSGEVTTPDGVRIHYFETGPRSAEAAADAPALLFVPGLTMPAQIWALQVEHFAPTHRVVAMDPRSQGRSQRTDDGHYPAARGRDVKAVVDVLDLAPVVPVCWSLAVAECVALVDQFGTRDLAGLVLVDGLAGGEWNPPFAQGMITWTGRMMRDKETMTEGFVRSMYQTPQSPEYLDRVTDWALQTPTDAIAALLVGGLTNDNRAVLPRIDRPVLLAVTRSPYLPAYEEMRDRLPDVRFEVFDAGHALFVDRAERFNRMVEELLAGLDGDGRATAEEDPAASTGATP